MQTKSFDAITITTYFFIPEQYVGDKEIVLAALSHFPEILATVATMSSVVNLLSPVEFLLRKHCLTMCKYGMLF